MRRRIEMIVLLVTFLASMSLQAIEFDPSKYEVYFGDFNGDGKANDVYIHGKDQFILIHGDIAIPLLISGPPGFVYYENRGDQPHALDLDRAQLASYTLAAINEDFSFVDTNNNGFSDIVVTTAEGHKYTLRGNNTSSHPTASIEYKRHTLFIHTDVLGSPVSESK